MKKLLVILIVFSVIVMVGCSTAEYPGLVDSALERDFRKSQIDDFQMRMFYDDWDSIWLRDKGTKLSYWRQHIGY